MGSAVNLQQLEFLTNSVGNLLFVEDNLSLKTFSYLVHQWININVDGDIEDIRVAVYDSTISWANDDYGNWVKVIFVYVHIQRFGLVMSRVIYTFYNFTPSVR